MPETSDQQHEAPSGGAGSSRREPVVFELPPADREAATVRRSGSSFASATPRAQDGIPPLPNVGDRIDTFEIGEAIGAGGMGAVFRATDLRLDRLVALKLLPPEQSKDSEAVQRFYQEARAAARLDHENIARVYTIGHDRSYHYIAFEYIDGTTIRQRVTEQGPLPVAEVINYMLQIAGALVHASERGVVHRDIKPSNIIVTPHGRAKLVDMGLARRFERGATMEDGLTQSGMTLGTFDYISPEQAQDPRNVDVRSDLYSLGCTMYHMLTGRPPFPEGTVLQKLLQHREEPAPDVRTLNPAVPADLSAIILKLMAKDPDRRYQVPEQLVRDLLALAGSLGLRSVSPEGLVWMSASSPPTWERHLVWGIPSMALAVVVALLVWWGERDDSGQRAIERPDASPTISALPPKATQPSGSSPLADATAGSGTESSKVVDRAAAEPSTAGEYMIRSVDEFARLIEDAPWGATLILATEGPFDVNLSPASSTTPPPPARDLTIRAAPGVRPVLRPNALTLNSVMGRAALLRFRGGRVVLEGLEFQLDAGDREDSLAAVLAEDTDLTIRACLFRTRSSTQSASRLESIHLRPDAESTRSGRPSPVVIRESHFDGGQSALHIQGQADVRVAECTFGPSAPAATFWFDNTSESFSPKVSLILDHVSIMAGSAPVVRLERTAATIRLNDSIVAPTLGVETTLVASDDPDRLDWLGRGNLYARIGNYLQPTRTRSAWEPITRFTSWEEDPTRTREIDSSASTTAVWAVADPIDLARGSEPTLAFLPDPAELPEGVTGVRIGPSGPVVSTIAKESTPFSGNLDSPAARAQTSANRSEVAMAPGPNETPAAAASGLPAEGPFPMLRGDDFLPMLRGTTRSTAPTDAPVGTSQGLAPVADAGLAGQTAEPVRETGPEPETPELTDQPEVADPDAVRTRLELQRILDQAEAPEQPITLASGVTYDLEPRQIRGTGRWVIKGSSSDVGRSQIRLRRSDFAGASGSVLFQLDRSVSLELRNVDLVIEGSGLPQANPTAGFVLNPGAYLNLVGCTVTVVDRGQPTAIVRVEASQETTDVASTPSADTSASTSFRATDCLIRSGQNVVEDVAGRALKLWFENCVIGARGALLNGHGRPREQRAGQIDLEMSRCTSRATGGLVVLESTATEPALPLIEARIRDSILTTGAAGGPLLRVNGQDAVEAVGDRIRWQGNSVAYHQIDTYRRDQTSLPGYMPMSFDRTDWGVAVGPRDISPFHGDVRFLNPWDDERPEWSITPDDVVLAPASPIRSYGPDLDLVARPDSRTL